MKMSYVKKLMSFTKFTITTCLDNLSKISFYFVNQTSIKFVIMFCFQFFEVYSSFSNVIKNEHFAFQNDFQNKISSIFFQK
jgi:hypothetical protein